MLFIDDLLLAPISGFKFILRTVVKAAEEQWTDDAPLKEELLHLQVMLEEGEIDEEEYVTRETEILQELREVQERKMRLAGASEEDLESRGPLSGKVAEGSGASITWDPDEQK